MGQIHVESWQAAYGDILPAEVLAKLSLERRQEMWKKMIEDKAGDMYVWDAAGEVLAFASLTVAVGEDREEKTDVELGAIYARPDCYGTGVGSRLWQAVETDFTGRRISLWVLEANALGRRFYEKNSFTIDPERKKTFAAGGSDFPLVRYRKRIAF